MQVKLGLRAGSHGQQKCQTLLAQILEKKQLTCHSICMRSFSESSNCMHCSCGCQFGVRGLACCLNFRIRDLTSPTNTVLHGESSKRLATPRNTKKQETPTIACH